VTRHKQQATRHKQGKVQVAERKRKADQQPVRKDFFGATSRKDSLGGTKHPQPATNKIDITKNGRGGINARPE
jgi:hypothetical protein